MLNAVCGKLVYMSMGGCFGGNQLPQAGEELLDYCIIDFVERDVSLQKSFYKLTSKVFLCCWQELLFLGLTQCLGLTCYKQLGVWLNFGGL